MPESSLVDSNVVANNSIYLDKLKCIGNETNLLQCSHRGTGIHQCRDNEKMALRCLPNGKLAVLNQFSLIFSILEDDLRLFQGQSGGAYERAEGILQMFHNNSWVSVCGDSFVKKAAEVACYQMGYQYVTLLF